MICEMNGSQSLKVGDRVGRKTSTTDLARLSDCLERSFVDWDDVHPTSTQRNDTARVEKVK
jgi:hypothetical protein